VAGTLVKVRFKLAWQNHKVGDVIQPNAMTRDWLIARGYVERVDPVEVGGGRPAKLARSAAKKLAEGAKGLFK
jgi:hypothetical protein